MISQHVTDGVTDRLMNCRIDSSCYSQLKTLISKHEGESVFCQLKIGKSDVVHNGPQQRKLWIGNWKYQQRQKIIANNDWVGCEGARKVGRRYCQGTETIMILILSYTRPHCHTLQGTVRLCLQILFNLPHYSDQLIRAK